jgi:hypothetical protein
MKTRILIFTLISLFMLGKQAGAQEYKMGLGIRLSSANATVNNSVSFKYFLNESNALEGLLSFDPATVGVLYEYHRQLGAPGFQWFFGGGGYVAFSGDNIVGAMGVVGLDYKFQNLPINLSLDWKPELNFVKDISFEAAAIGLSIRFAFK